MLYLNLHSMWSTFARIYARYRPSRAHWSVCVLYSQLLGFHGFLIAFVSSFSPDLLLFLHSTLLLLRCVFLPSTPYRQSILQQKYSTRLWPSSFFVEFCVVYFSTSSSLHREGPAVFVLLSSFWRAV